MIKETDDTCTSTEHGHANLDERLHEETAGTIDILKEKYAAEYISTPKWTNCAPKSSSGLKLFYKEYHQKITDMIRGKSQWSFSR
ncbi:hypothetical protein AVEN_59993-1 [Araneus ventricosus]|uniref:Uncharacterized protein n=1 Tax=Araneus ventricosus TaxID=182803 RepID=A0A4Y2CAS9_ARAVE|nr:hypothetical protein AVEN_59993-1 [Araneus ventricosus]